MRKVILSILFLMLGLASWDAALENADSTPNVREGQVRLSSDGTPPPR